MSTQNKTLLSWICAVVSFFAFGIIFAPIGIYLGAKASEEGASRAPMIVNIVMLVMTAIGLFFML